MKQHFTMFAAYNQWANRRIYDAAAVLSQDDLERNVGVFFNSLLGTLNHLLVADRIWMKRFTGGGEAPTTLDAIIHRDFGKLRRAREIEDKRIIDWVSFLGDKAFDGRFTYMTATDMRTISQRLSPALAHFFNHQTHHRGQIHAILTRFGSPSVEIDLIYFQRSENGRSFA
ncbi:MAG: DinB family protein [Rhizobiaceae bacterium]